MKTRSQSFKIKQEGHTVTLYRKEWWGILRVWTSFYTRGHSNIESANELYESIVNRFNSKS